MNSRNMNESIFKRFLLVWLFAVLTLVLHSQSIDSLSFDIFSRQSFYSYEKSGEFLLHVPANMTGRQLAIELKICGISSEVLTGFHSGKIIRIPFKLNLTPSVYKVEARVRASGKKGVIYLAKTYLVVLSYKSNEVKTDILTGGLIVNKLPFFPFGFYCYSPVYPTLPEEETVKGFNLISPYQKIMPETFVERKAYMDRCAELGMKVHFNLLSVSGGGGVGSKIDGLDDIEKRERLINEIKTFMDHPALLGWYISDEPNGNNISPEQLEDIYRIVKETDPWHPVSIVFMAPFTASKKYFDAMDIVMADPYPIPDYPVAMAGEVASKLKAEFNGKKPFWIVPQAFGGGELWSREPTIQEIRSMTWQSIIKGATGIQYFVRQGLNYFPKSSATWSECGRIATEVAELTPWLLSEEESLPVTSENSNVSVSSRIYNGRLIIMAVNKVNEPLSVSFNTPADYNGKARVLFENRQVTVRNGHFYDQMSSLGSQVYLINLKSDKSESGIPDKNLLKDPGFEDLSSPGVPSACYARPGGDRGATYFLDSRTSYKGIHSLRIITPQENKSLAIRFFPFRVKAGASYTVSLWAKADPEWRHLQTDGKDDPDPGRDKRLPQYVEILLGDFGHARFVPDGEWKQYMTFVTIPADTTSDFKTNLILKMPGQGVAWFDEVRVIEDK